MSWSFNMAGVTPEQAKSALGNDGLVPDAPRQIINGFLDKHIKAKTAQLQVSAYGHENAEDQIFTNSCDSCHIEVTASIGPTR